MCPLVCVWEPGFCGTSCRAEDGHAWNGMCQCRTLDGMEKDGDLLCKYWPWGWASLVGVWERETGFFSWDFVLSRILGVLKVSAWCDLSFLQCEPNGCSAAFTGSFPAPGERWRCDHWNSVWQRALPSAPCVFFLSTRFLPNFPVTAAAWIGCFRNLYCLRKMRSFTACQKSFEANCSPLKYKSFSTQGQVYYITGPCFSKCRYAGIVKLANYLPKTEVCERFWVFATAVFLFGSGRSGANFPFIFLWTNLLF